MLKKLKIFLKHFKENILEKLIILRFKIGKRPKINRVPGGDCNCRCVFINKD